MVQNGIDRIHTIRPALSKARIGLVMSAASVTAALELTVDALSRDYAVTALFAPEHGIRGEAQAGEPIQTYQDKRTGLPVYSLYGTANRPTEEMFSMVDVVIIDLQDVGSRFYTFISTMRNVMEGCARQGKKVILLDRINPINGVVQEGGILDTRFASFVGIAPIPQRHGMTIGELALFLVGECNVCCDLEVVKLSNWSREMYFEQAGLFWVNPSPNIPSADAALIYSGTCLFEGTNLSEGRGTTHPFECIGAPWLDAEEAAAELNTLQLEGVLFRPIYFQPTYSKHKGQLCQGVQVHIADKNIFRPVETGLRMLFLFKKLSGNRFEWLPPHGESGHYFIDLLAGTDQLRCPNAEPNAILESWQQELNRFIPIGKKYYLY